MIAARHALNNWRLSARFAVTLILSAAGLAGLGVASEEEAPPDNSGTVPILAQRERDCPAPNHQVARDAIRGKVVDDHGPVAGASVGEKGRPERVATDASGRFAVASEAATPGTASRLAGSRRLVASKPGYYISGCDLPTDGPAKIRLRRHPPGDSLDYRWVASEPDPAKPEQCGNCHEAIFREWSEGGHAQSATNPHFMNLYEGTDWHGNEDIGWSLLAELPEGSGVCFSCHVPSLEPDPRVISDLRRTSGVALQGVHCDFCHKIADVRIDRVGLEHGRFAIRLARPTPGEQIFFGPLDDDDRSSSVYSLLYRKSRYCASCHEGILFGTHAYGEYSEWLASPYAKRGVECQDCHMAPTGQMTNIAPGQGGIDRDPQTLASHGSLRGRAEGLARYLLLKIEGTASKEQVEIVARVRMRDVGHRFPTGYPDRQLILWVRATDAAGRPIELLEGPVLPPLAGDGPPHQGGLAGEPGRMYAKVLEGLDGQKPVPYWRPNRVGCDTRLAPDAEDCVRFRFRRTPGKVTAVAQLIYRRFSKRLADQKAWPDNEVTVARREITR